MTNPKITLQECAMRYGTAMGLFWTFKFMLFPLGLRMPLLQLVFLVLTLGVPVLGYLLAKRFRERDCAGSLSFGRAFLFTTYMYLFASILVAVTHYIYFRYLDQGFIFATYRDMIEQFRGLAQAETLTSLDQLSQAIDTLAGLTPIQLTLQLISQNVFYGVFLALPTALLVMRRTPKF